MFSATDIIAKAWLVQETVNLMIAPKKVQKIFLVGSYAVNSQSEFSDLDFLVEISREKVKHVYQFYPEAKQILAVQAKFKPSRIHIIFGTEEAQRAMHKPFKEILNASTYQSDLPRN